MTAKGSSDPDGDTVSYRWFIYNEAGGYTGDSILTNPTSQVLKFYMPELPKGVGDAIFVYKLDGNIQMLIGKCEYRKSLAKKGIGHWKFPGSPSVVDFN
ncbi:MAG TPA: hypothetical protein VK957_02150 [Lunatimonas sp.]|nr:hypothetical protein [Lunatimonas sp.]